MGLEGVTRPEKVCSHPIADDWAFLGSGDPRVRLGVQYPNAARSFLAQVPGNPSKNIHTFTTFIMAVNAS